MSTNKKTKFFVPRAQSEKEDLYGMNLLTDGDRMGEVIPSMHAWMPPEAMRERVNYHEEVTRKVGQKNRQQGTKKA